MKKTRPVRAFPAELLLCPNCRGELTFLDTNVHYACESCEAIFPIENGIIRLLPLELNGSKLAECKVHQLNPEVKATIDSPSWFSLIQNSESIRYLQDIILKKWHFKGRLLEIGAGTCYASALIKLNNPLTEVVAFDISESLLMKGREVCELMDSDVDWFVSGDCENFPFEDEIFDFVFGSAIIHHCPKPEIAIDEIFRILKRGGTYLGIKEPMSNRVIRCLWKSRFSIFGQGERKYGIKENIFGFKEWVGMFKHAGFRQINVSLEKDWRYYSNHWLVPFYIKLVSVVPDELVKRLMTTRIKISALK